MLKVLCVIFRVTRLSDHSSPTVSTGAVGVGTGDAVAVGVFVGVGVEVGDTVAVGVSVGIGVKVGDAVIVGFAVGIEVGVRERVEVGEGVTVGPGDSVGTPVDANAVATLSIMPG